MKKPPRAIRLARGPPRLLGSRGYASSKETPCMAVILSDSPPGSHRLHASG